ncbi:hypothetical protein OESDEN_24189 [Oesophagostomum dentatum]|uniref:SEC7 domain-containing protein n=1 Tax=Oesophagostomum dentatum TaxID=61180 RepID=A0A0B1RX47_OESDE|nr:hypothetical protein OESDEN_24189 [Oesophagostomum dentatum]
MQLEQFIHNLRGQDKMRGEKEGIDIDRACLQGIYERVRAEEIRPGDDHVAQVARVDAAIVARDKPVRGYFYRVLYYAYLFPLFLCILHEVLWALLTNEKTES